MKLSSRFRTTTLILVSSVMLSFPALAVDGKAWGGQCVVNNGSSYNSASCGSEGVSCSGNGRGGVDCTWNGVAGKYEEDTHAVEEKKLKLRAKPALSKDLKVQKSIKE